MKLPKSSACVAAGLLLSCSLAHAGQNFDGAPILLQSQQFHISGKPVTAELLVAELHEMNQPGFQPVGLWRYFYVLPDGAAGNGAICERWFNQVLSDQSKQSSESQTFAWLEIQVSDQVAQIQTDEGTWLVPDSGISCWEALEFNPNQR